MEGCGHASRGDPATQALSKNKDSRVLVLSEVLKALVDKRWQLRVFSYSFVFHVNGPGEYATGAAPGTKPAGWQAWKANISARLATDSRSEPHSRWRQ